MKSKSRLLIWLGVIVLGAGIALGYFFQSPSPKQAVVSAMNERSQAVQALARLPLRFEAGASPGQFVARGASYGLALTPTAVGITIPHFDKTKRPQPIHKRRGTDATKMQMRLLGANPQAQAVGQEAQAGSVNYLTGNDSAKWRKNVPTYGKVKYQAIYPGIDLIYYGTGKQLEYDFIVAPGSQPQAIQLEFAGTDKIEINPAGELVLAANDNQLVQHKPVIYQEVNGQRRHIEGGYTQLDEQHIGFRIGSYDESLPLVIDPVLSYSTYLGGNDEDVAYFLALDQDGNIYLQGNTVSTDFPSSAGQTPPGGTDMFIAKLNPNKSTPDFITYLGGTGEDYTGGIAVDRRGNIYLGGNTTSTDFPTRNAIQPEYGGDEELGYGDAYVAKLAPSGTEIIYATYLGGSSEDSSSGIALDREGNVYVTGLTLSADFPTRRAAQPQYGGGDVMSGVGLIGDAFIAKVNPTGSALVYSTYLGGSTDDGATNITLDSEGAVYISGNTTSTDFPVVQAFQSNYGGAGSFNAGDGFVAKLAANGRRFEYVTYLGGASDDEAWAVVVDAIGSIYVTGGTASANFPIRNAFQPTYGGIPADDGFGDAFVTKILPNGRQLAYSTFLGKSGYEIATGLFVDANGHAYVCGQTTSPDFPTLNPVQAQFARGDYSGDGFVTEFSASGKQLLFSSFLGGSTDDWMWTLKVNRLGDIFTAGFTTATDFPTTSRAPQKRKGIGDNYDAFIAKIDNRTDCRSVCLYAPEYWLSFPQRIPNGVVYLDQFFAVPTNSPAVRAALDGGFTPLQRLRAEFVAYQLSLAATPAPQQLTAQPLGCLGSSFRPVTLSNGEVIDVDMKGNEFFLQIQEALRRHNQEDLRDLAALLDQFHGKGLGGCSRDN